MKLVKTTLESSPDSTSRLKIQHSTYMKLEKRSHCLHFQSCQPRSGVEGFCTPREGQTSREPAIRETKPFVFTYLFF